MEYQTSKLHSRFPVVSFRVFSRASTRQAHVFLPPHFRPSRPLDPTDLVNIDVTVFINGYHGDTSKTFLLPEAVSSSSRLLGATSFAQFRRLTRRVLFSLFFIACFVFALAGRRSSRTLRSDGRSSRSGHQDLWTWSAVQ